MSPLDARLTSYLYSSADTAETIAAALGEPHATVTAALSGLERAGIAAGSEAGFEGEVRILWGMAPTATQAFEPLLSRYPHRLGEDGDTGLLDRFVLGIAASQPNLHSASAILATSDAAGCPEDPGGRRVADAAWLARCAARWGVRALERHPQDEVQALGLASLRVTDPEAALYASGIITGEYLDRIVDEGSRRVVTAVRKVLDAYGELRPLHPSTGIPRRSEPRQIDHAAWFGLADAAAAAALSYSQETSSDVTPLVVEALSQVTPKRE